MQFFHELTIEMNREWFEANKPRYQQLWVEPLASLLEEVRGKLVKPYAPLKLGPPKIFRIHRDVRFSKDKTPYKTNVAGTIWLREMTTAMYIHIGPDEEFIGAGTYFFDPPQLPKWRKLVAADKTGKPLMAIVQKLRKAGYEVGGHDDYKKVPKPFDETHPRAELLKMRGLTTSFPPMPKGLLHKPQLTEWLVTHAVAQVPLVTWLYKNIK